MSNSIIIRGGNEYQYVFDMDANEVKIDKDITDEDESLRGTMTAFLGAFRKHELSLAVKSRKFWTELCAKHNIPAGDELLRERGKIYKRVEK